MEEEDEDNETPVIVVPYIQQYRPHWRRFRRNIPWFGPRPGGRWFGRRHRHMGRRVGGGCGKRGGCGGRNRRNR